MASPVRRDARRFRRRILGAGGAAFVVLFIVMAPMYVDSVEADLEARVPDELAAAGYLDVSASFDGQDGTLSCGAPLPAPEQARQVAYDVWGVRSIELDRSCRVNTAASDTSGDEGSVQDESSDGISDATSPADTAAPPTTNDDGGDVDATAVLSAIAPSDSAADSTVPAGPAFESLAAAVDGNPQLSLLSVLLQEAGLEGEFADVSAAPLTLFAPSDDAFEALPADVIGGLRADPRALRELLSHHTAAGSLMTPSLVAGDLEMSDRSVQPIGESPLTIGGSEFVAVDIDAPNGVVHIIDAVLVPDGVDSSETPEAASVNAELAGTSLTLTGAVAAEEVRSALAQSTAASGVVVTDALIVDARSGLDGATADRLAPLLAALAGHLVNGSAGFDGEALYLGGTYLTDPDREATVAAANSVGVEPTLTPPPQATADDAISLEDELNAYVSANPVLFESDSATITDSSSAVLDEIALLARQFDSIAITVEGHTDSDGNANDNLWLSRMRARAVSDALADRGLAEGAVTWEGFGDQQPVVVDGVEDKAASRRVEFRVEALA
jgi:outer membrane protein OmpA-like peptidoglycan-associated protein/uncharacterized surface protein with fasciclin (FAS1) repeats